MLFKHFIFSLLFVNLLNIPVYSQENLLPDNDFETTELNKKSNLPARWGFWANDDGKNSSVYGIDTGISHSGKCSMFIKRTEKKGIARVVAPLVKVKAGDRLRISGYIKITNGTAKYIVFFKDKNRKTVSGDAMDPFTSSPGASTASWGLRYVDPDAGKSEKFNRADLFVTVPENAEYVSVSYELSNTIGKAWFDDLGIMVLSSTK
jgi:hypothetical protein